MRVIIDMLRAAKDSVAASDILGGLFARPDEEGAALAADLFAAFVAGDCTTISESVGGDGNGLRSQVRV